MAKEGIIDSISDETVRQTLKKMKSSLGWKNNGVFSQVNAEYVFRMEDVLDLYNEPYDPKRPVVQGKRI